MKATDTAPHGEPRGAQLEWAQSFLTMASLELKGAELNSVRRWINAVINPVAYFGLLGLGLAAQFGDANYLRFIVPGVIVMQAITSMTQMIYRTVIERRWGLAALKLQAGVPWTAYLAGLLLPRVLIFAAQGAVVAVLALVLVHPLSPPQLGLCVTAALSSCIFWSLLGLVITGWIRSYQTRDFVVGLVVTPLAFAAPVFYALDNAPAVIKIISAINPISYQVKFARAALDGAFDASSAGVSLILVVAMVAVARISMASMRTLSFEA